MNIALLLSATLLAAPIPGYRHFAVTNDSRSSLIAIEASTGRGSDWIMLPVATVPYGDTIHFELPRALGCSNDLRATYRNGMSVVFAGLDTCRHNRYRLKVRASHVQADERSA